jgi:hypothetical protein
MANVNWTPLIKLHGHNGLLQVLVSLLWWAEGLALGQPLDHLGWFLAVSNVLWTLEQMLKPGVIGKQ